MFITRLIDTFIQRLRLYTIDRLQLKFGSLLDPNEYIKHAVAPLKKIGRKISENPEAWDLAQLISMLNEHKESVF